MEHMNAKGNVSKQWAGRLEAFLPDFLSEHPALSPAASRVSLILHGSTCMDIDDEWSDLDLWLLMSEEDLARFDAASPTRFVEFTCDGKVGHMNAVATTQFRQQVERCHMDTIWQLRRSKVIVGGAEGTEAIVALARKPMPAETREALFMWHYTEMRGEHRAMDNPIERKDPVAVLLSLPKAVAHALRAAMVLDGEPYPYDKWLYRAAAQTPTGTRIEPLVQRVIDALSCGALSLGGPEREHPIGRELRAIRAVLIDAARAGGLDRPWLDKWWLHMDQARSAFDKARWV